MTGPRHILTIDVGGSHVKLGVSNRRAIKQFESGSSMTARQMVNRVKNSVDEWNYHFVSIGFPGVVIDGRIVCEPINLGCGWTGFNFEKAFGRPTRIMNDAAMQALGSYSGGRMLFLGFGTALGAVLVDNGTIHPMELPYLPFKKRGQVQNFVGADALRRLGRKRWSANATLLIKQLAQIVDAEHVIIGGGNAPLLGRLPKGTRLGHNDLAFVGGFRAWRSGRRQS